MIYDAIVREINNYLGEEYVLKYANNHDLDWSSILPEKQEELVYGILRVDSATTTQLGDGTIRNEQLRLTLAIPEKREIFNATCSNIKGLLQQMNGYVCYDTDGAVQLFFGEDVDAEGTIINGHRWWMKNIIFSASFYENIITATDREITVDGNPIKGIISTNFLREVSVDGVVFNGTALQKGFSNSYKKQLQVEAVFVKNDPVITSLLQNEDNIFKTYTVVYNNGFKTRTMTCTLVTLNENIITGNFLRATLVFLGGN